MNFIERRRLYSHMTPLERRHLEKICDKYGIDYYEIDSAIDYSENKEHLMGIVRMLDGCLDAFELARMMEQQEQYIAENPLEYYLSHRLAGQVRETAELGEVNRTPQQFSLKTMTHIRTRFSLRSLIKQQM